MSLSLLLFFFFSSRRRHTRLVSDWSSDVCSSDLGECALSVHAAGDGRPRCHLVVYRGGQPRSRRPGGNGDRRRLAKHPRTGTKRRDITPLPLRFWTVTRFPNYVIVYRPETVPLQGGR